MIMADRPWKWSDRQPYVLGVQFGIDKIAGVRQTGVAWAALGLGHQIAEEGEFGAPSVQEAVTAAILKFREMKARYPSADGEPQIVELYRYTKKSWERSVAAAEGGTHEAHEAKLKAVKAALEAEGAVVRFKIV